MRERQWIRVQLPDIKSLSIPIKISRTPFTSHLTEKNKNLFDDLSDDDEERKPGEVDLLAKKKRKTMSTDALDIFLLNPDPIKNQPLETNSSTLALSNTHLLLHDHQKLILFDFSKKLNELQWNDNEFGSCLLF